MPKPDYHVFICSQKRPPGHPRGSCSEKGCDALAPAFANAVIKRGLLNKISIVQTSCLGPCQTGANVLVYPGNVLYSAVQPGDVDTIIDQHLVGGEVVAAKVAPAEVW